MCGIFAAMTREALDPRRAQRALNILEHRGPDGAGLWQSESGLWTLGHTRLSIIGLNNGEQPMHGGNDRVHMVVNGEFYGYRTIREQLRTQGYHFTTESDSEIALHLYLQRGVQAASSLRGEFAVVIADERQKMMVGIRDRFGVKPLYYTCINGEVFFASEIKALVALGVPAQWDYENVYGSLGGQHESSLFHNIKAVPPGCYAVSKGGAVRIYSYWEWDIPTAAVMAQDTRSETEVVVDFRDALLDSVRERLVADVEVGCYLSGGIDSCAVLGLAQKEMTRPIKAFTLTFDDPVFNEGAVAEAQAKFVGADYHPVPISGQDIADNFADAIWHTEILPINGNGTAKYILSKAVRDAGIKVVFTGEGSDEMLGGYPYFRVDAILNNPAYTEAQKVALINEMFEANPASRAVMMPDVVENNHLKSVVSRLGWLPSVFNTTSALIGSVADIYTPEFLYEIGDYDPIAECLDRLPIDTYVTGRDRLNQSLYMNTKMSLPNMILTYLGDRMEMAHSVEGRVPFLDHHVAAAAARVPVNMKLKGTREKHVLREAAKDVLIDEVYNRQKHPFFSPPVRHKNDPMIEFYRDTFASQAAKDQPIFDVEKAQDMVDYILTCPADMRVGIEGSLIRVASTIVIQDRFKMGTV